MNGARGRRELVKRIGKKTEHDGVQQHAIKSSFIHMVSSSYQCKYS